MANPRNRNPGSKGVPKSRSPMRPRKVHARRPAETPPRISDLGSRISDLGLLSVFGPRTSGLGPSRGTVDRRASGSPAAGPGRHHPAGPRCSAEPVRPARRSFSIIPASRGEVRRNWALDGGSTLDYATCITPRIAQGQPLSGDGPGGGASRAVSHPHRPMRHQPLPIETAAGVAGLLVPAVPGAASENGNDPGLQHHNWRHPRPQART